MPLTEASGQPNPMQAGEFTPSADSRAVSFNTSKVAPPSHVYIQRDDQLLITITSPIAGPHVVTLRARLLLPEGKIITIENQVTLVNIVTNLTQPVPLTEGFLLSIAVLDTVGQTPGFTFVRVVVSRGTNQLANTAQLLISGYTTINQPACWPGADLRFPQEGPGAIASIHVTNPAAGVDWQTQPGTGVRWRLISFNAVYTASAAVATRVPNLIITDGAANRVFTGVPTQGIVASAAVSVTGSTVIQPNITASNTVTVPLPLGMIVEGAQIVEVITQAIQAADQWSAIFLNVEQWVTGF